MDADGVTGPGRAIPVWGEVDARPPWMSFHGSRAAFLILSVPKIRFCNNGDEDMSVGR